MTDHRSPEAQAYRYLYRSTAWRKGRVLFLREHPLCVRCMAKGLTVPATVVNHIKPHKGDLTLFFDRKNMEAVCKRCHDGAIQQIERIGFSTCIGVDGWPTDAKHPANR